MDVAKKNIEKYLNVVKKSIMSDCYRIERNLNRLENNLLFIEYLVNEEKLKEILLNLDCLDFSCILQNEHKSFKKEKLYVFGKEIVLRKRTDGLNDDVTLYIKINKLRNGYVVVVSMHKAKHPINYYFK